VLHKTSNSYVILLFEGQQRPRPLGKSGVEKRAGTGRRGQKAGRERDERKDRSRSNKEEKGERGEEIGGETQERHRRERRWLLRVQAQACPSSHGEWVNLTQPAGIQSGTNNVNANAIAHKATNTE